MVLYMDEQCVRMALIRSLQLSAEAQVDGAKSDTDVGRSCTGLGQGQALHLTTLHLLVGCPMSHSASTDIGSSLS